MTALMVNSQHSKAQQKRMLLREDAISDADTMPRGSFGLDGVTFMRGLDASEDARTIVESYARELSLDVEHHKWFENGAYQVDEGLMRWSQGKSTKYLHYCGTLKYKSGWSRVYMVSNKYSSRLYFSIGGMIQYSDEKLDLITRLNRNIDKNILRIRLERSDLLLYNYEISIDYSMRYTSFMAEYLHIFTDGARNKTKLYSSLKGDKELLDTREKLLDGIVYLGASGSRYIYDKTKKNSLAFDLTRFEIRGRYDEERESKSYILGYLQRKLFFNVDRVSTVLDLSRVPDAYKECYF